MATPWNLDELEIVGYANVLKKTMLPSVVPPVYRLKSNPQRAFLPPYSLNAGYLCNSTEVPQPELEDLKDSRRITLFDAPFPARADFELWVDQAFCPHYQPIEEANRELNCIATVALRQAEIALQRGDIHEAERLSGVAISADDRRVDPLVIKAAIRRLQNNSAGERLMEELAAHLLDKEPFRLLVDHYSASVPPSTRTTAEEQIKSPMSMVARCFAA